MHARQGRVRVPGSLHSCSEIVVADAILDTSALPKTIEFDDGDAAVEASANVSLHDFLAALGRRGKSVTATGGTDHQTLAGLISTGTAPASSRYALYELLEWVELVTVDATTGRAVERRIARGDDDFPAVVCSLGLLGVLTRVRFRLVDERHFAVVMKVVDIDDVLADLDATSARYDFWRVNLVPDSTKALLWAATDIPRGDSKPDGDYPEDQSEQILDVVFKVLDKLGGEGPLLSGPLELVYDVMARTYDERNFTGPLRNMLPVDRRAPLRVAMAEWSFRPQDLQRVLGECEQFFGQHRWPNIPTEIELTKVDGSFMSAWNWDGLPYIAKLNFMYLTEVCKEPEEKAAIFTPPARALAAPRARRHPVQGALGEDQLHRRRVRAPQSRRRPVPAAGLADVPEPVPGGASAVLIDIHAHPAMNAFLWGRDLRRHYWTGPVHTFNPLASLSDFKMLEKGGVDVLWSSLHIPERQFLECGVIRFFARFFAGGRRLAEGQRRGTTCWCRWRTWSGRWRGPSGSSSPARTPSWTPRSRRGRPRSSTPSRAATSCPPASAENDVPGRLARVDHLADRGVASITLAHLFPNDLAGHAEAIPEDQRKFPICPLDTGVDLSRGLTAAGRAVVERMVERRIVPDVAHCTPVARREIYDLVDNRIPIVASHVGVRSMNDVEYNVDRGDVRGDRRLGRRRRRHLHAALAGQGASRARARRDLAHDGRRCASGPARGSTSRSAPTSTASPTRRTTAPTRASSRSCATLLQEHALAPADVDAVLGGNARRVLRDGWR